MNIDIFWDDSIVYLLPHILFLPILWIDSEDSFRLEGQKYTSTVKKDSSTLVVEYSKTLRIQECVLPGDHLANTSASASSEV